MVSLLIEINNNIIQALELDIKIKNKIDYEMDKKNEEYLLVKNLCLICCLVLLNYH